MRNRPKPLRFPEDESAHDAAIEWWYVNGHVYDAVGHEYSYMDCLFKVDVKKIRAPFLSKMPLGTAYCSHALLSDVPRRRFEHRIAPISIVSDDSFSKRLLFINYLNPEIKNGYTNCTIEKTGESAYHIKNEDLDLQLSSTKPPLLEGGAGFLELGSKSTYYYSLTNLKTEGRIKSNDTWIDVSGTSWMDHQWSDATYAKGEKNRWDWFSIQLDTDTEIVCCRFNDGVTTTGFAGISYADGSQEHVSEIEIIPLKKQWKSAKSKAVYPLSWKIVIPGKHIALRLTAKIPHQEMLFGAINYWEGPLRVEGEFAGIEVAGVGFMELVGYPSRYNNVKYIRDEIGRTATRFFSTPKKARRRPPHSK